MEKPHHGLPFPDGFAEPESARGWVEAFDSLSQKSPFGVTGHAYFCPKQDEIERREHLVLSFAVHGNEWGTLPAAVALLFALSSKKIVAKGPVSLLLGNLEAIARDVRFVEEDYNRVFVFDREATSIERKRAEAVRPILDEADFLFDMHQTQTPTHSAFWTFPWTEELGDWARIIQAAPRALVRAPRGAFSPGTKCLDEYVRDRGKVGITAEFGEKGSDPLQARAVYRACEKLIEAFDLVSTGRAQRAQLAKTSPELAWFETVDVVAPPSPEAKLRDGLCCFTEVRQGEVLSAAQSPPIRASRDGYLLFPKYPLPGQPLPPEIVRLAVEIDDPKSAFAS